MKLTFLGTGTSHGVPMIGCQCAVCRSTDPRNRRTRSSICVQDECGAILVVDVGPEFRIQALAADLVRLDAVALSHGHADHIMGLDDLRRFNELQHGAVPVWGSASTLRAVRRSFAYVFDPGPPGPTCPSVELHEFGDFETFSVGRLQVTPLPCQHGPFRIHGFLIEEDRARLGYFPDCNGLPEETIRRLQGVDVFSLDGLRDEPHPTHFCLSESLVAMARVGAKQSYITHICHRLEHEATQRRLPSGVHVPYDGLTIQVGHEVAQVIELG